MKSKCPSCGKMGVVRPNGLLAAHGKNWKCPGSGTVVNKELHDSTRVKAVPYINTGGSKPSWGQASCCEEHSIPLMDRPRRMMLSDEYGDWRNS